MKLHFFNDNKNFGDQLNPWLWRRLIPDLLEVEDDISLVGIGTILDHKIAKLDRKIIFGSGTGYAQCAPIDNSWKILCVRGPLSASRLGIDKSLAITDSAALLAIVGPPKIVNTGKIIFMPHISSNEHCNWKLVCNRVGVTYLDPSLPVDYVLSSIASAELVIAEAMHGAIVADTLRVPWAPVSLYPHINHFKWSDWCLSLGMTFNPVLIDPIYRQFEAERGRHGVWTESRGLIGKIKRLPEQIRWGILHTAFEKRMRRRQDNFCITLSEIMAGKGICLSDNLIFSSRVDQLSQKLEELKTIHSSWVSN
ncbi:MAG: polysaccharide pyruvyl transferase family protein [Phycisphaerales bacterium]|nr:polysaccharide pyruvyl transferase family protein [Phycisphaerales bacterium]